MIAWMSLPTAIPPPGSQVPRCQVRLVGRPMLLVLLLGWTLATTHRSRHLLLFLDRGHVRAPARPAQYRSTSVEQLGSARPGGRDRVPDVPGSVDRHHHCARHGRRGRSHTKFEGRNSASCNEYFTVVHGQTRPDVGRPGRRPAPALAEHAPSAVGQDREERPSLRVEKIQRRDVGRYTHRLVDLRRGRRDLDRGKGPLRGCVHGGDLDLHAARLTEAQRPDRPALSGPAPVGRLLHRTDRACARARMCEAQILLSLDHR